MTHPPTVASRPQRHREGLPCPTCASHQTKVSRTRFKPSTGEIYRRHRCLDCHRRFTSSQRVVSHADEKKLAQVDHG